MKNDFSDIEQALKAEAAQNLPEFNEEAWHKMEALLDKDERRPKIIFWFSGIALVILLLTALYLVNRKNNPDKISDKQISNTGTAKENQPATTGAAGSTSHIINEQDSMDKHIAVNPDLADKMNVEDRTDKHVTVNRNFTNTTKLTQPSQSRPVLVKPSRGNKGGDNRGFVKSQVQSNDAVANEERIAEKENNMTVSIPVREVKKPEVDSQSTTVAATEAMPAPAVTQSDSAKTEKKDKSIKTSRFYVTGVIGMGTDKTSLGSASKLTPKYGVGAGFAINNKWSLGIGVRVHRKIYTGGPDDYRVKSGYWSMVDIQEVDANCLVYEIPVTVNYNLFEKNNCQVFASAGLSSFIMKKEKYDFSYINSSGQQAKGAANYTGNKHFFSSINLGIGVSKKMNKRLQLFAVPSVALPVNGIGEGAIKLKSFEIAAGFNYFLFK